MTKILHVASLSSHSLPLLLHILVMPHRTPNVIVNLTSPNIITFLVASLIKGSYLHTHTHTHKLQLSLSGKQTIHHSLFILLLQSVYILR